MSHNQNETSQSDFNRRDFIKGASFGSLMLAMGGVPLQAADPPLKDTGYKTDIPPVPCAVIGCGAWGREVLQTLALLLASDGKTQIAPVVAICDNYKAYLNRAKEFAPKAETYDDYKSVLALKDVQAVVVCTPSHLHKEIVIAALQAGKHVYCEAPLATTLEDAQAIAKAAKAANRVNFQTGLQMRSDPVKHDTIQFIRDGAIGPAIMARSQSHSKQSWRRTSPNPDREKALNWRLDKSTSIGLIGELGVHQIDLFNWYLNHRASAVTGFGGILNWNDGRDVPDTIQTIIQYPGKINFVYDATLANSFDNDYDMLYGTFGTVMMRYEVAAASSNGRRESKAWWFKEVDAPLVGWEIYAAKEQFRHETGLALSAGSTKSVKTAEAADVSPFAESALHYALKAFVTNSHGTATDVANFVANYGADAEGLSDYLAEQAKTKSRLAAAGWQEGYDATVTAIMANDAIMQGKNIEVPKSVFDV